ncbi:unnamed protein product [Cylindrotheca closterium]|uniref:DUF3752 domain-containing protein n=1 Tax=Cylindrotheca closterium TaxID=2856 RepID=A0AAD2G781_9STRA|nr:unnamed protein product [Cylindrotheca closterium]
MEDYFMSDDEENSEHNSVSRRKSRKHGEHKGSQKRNRRHKEDKRRDRRKRHKDRKQRDDNSRKSRRKHRHRNKSVPESVTVGERRKTDSGISSEGDDAISQTLCSLLEDRPVFSGELPIILIRLAGGAAFDLRQMTDTAAAERLEQVFESLQMFGVQRQTTNDHWIFRNPNKQNGADEMILLRVMRTVLDDSGVTMSSIEDYESKRAALELKSTNAISVESSKEKTLDALQPVKTATAALLEEFKNSDSNLGQQLIVLCRSILEGECLCIDGLPNDSLKARLTSIFLQCGLEKSEMEENESDDGNSRGEVTTGYNLPEDIDETVKLKLHAFMDECRRPREKPKRRLVGPQRPQYGNTTNPTASDDDEGPLPVGSSSRRSTIQSTQPEISNGEDTDFAKEKREEWMLVPGKNDFLSSIKSGQSINSRGFKNQKPPTEPIEEGIHPEIRREIDCINAAHNEARGPSLMLQHRARKQKEDNEKGPQGEEKWKWSRDIDLDYGRRVDKNALKMILGGAATDLQSKFQGTYNK